MKEKRGFTLIELLAVIVILAIIALIATPIVLSLIDRARHGAAEDSAYGIRKEAQLLYQTTMMGRAGAFNKIEVDFSKTMEKDGKTYVETKLYETASSAGETNKVFFEADGTMPTNGKITINGDGTINYEILTISNYYCCIPAQGNVTCAKENNFDGNCSSNIQVSTPTLKVGDLVKMTPSGESFDVDSTKCGTDQTITINPKELNIWRIIRINENGTFDMVSEYLPSFTYVDGGPSVQYIKGITGYRNYIGCLNDIASHYENVSYTVGSRHMGYDSAKATETLTFGPEDYTQWTKHSSTTNESTTAADELIGGGDIGYLTDVNLVTTAYTGVKEAPLTANIVGTDTPWAYFLASRVYVHNESFCDDGWGIRWIAENGSHVYNAIIKKYDGDWYSPGQSYNILIRPIVTLKANTTIVSGDGETEQTAYVIS